MKRNAPGRWPLVVTAGVAVALLVAVTAALYFFGMRTEQVRDLRVEVAIQSDDSALVRETITYDFGSASRHGIRWNPLGRLEQLGDSEEPLISDLSVRSASAPADMMIESYDHLRIGDPDEEISGEHTYEIEYRLPDAVDHSAEFLSSSAMSSWTVPVDKVEYTVRAPFELNEAMCSMSDTDVECTLDEESKTAVTASAEGLDAYEKLMIYAKEGAATGGNAQLPPPEPLPEGNAWWWLTPLLLIPAAGLVGYAIGAVAGLACVRWASRDHAGPGGERITTAAADRQVMQQGVPPRGLTPAQAGIVWDGRLTDTHRIAWLAQQADEGWIEISRMGGKVTRVAPDETWGSAPKPLKTLLRGNSTADLGSYKLNVAQAWSELGDELAEWRRTSGLLDLQAERRAKLIQRSIGVLGLVAAIGGAVALYFVAATDLPLAMVVAGVSAVLVGAGVSAMTRGHELHVRTPQGFAARQQIAGFRRHLEWTDSGGRGDSGPTAAWAGALGLLDQLRDHPDTAAFTGLAVMIPLSIKAPTPSGGSGTTHTYTGGGSSGGGSSGGGGGSSW